MAFDYKNPLDYLFAGLNVLDTPSAMVRSALWVRYRWASAGRCTLTKKKDSCNDEARQRRRSPALDVGEVG